MDIMSINYTYVLAGGGVVLALYAIRKFNMLAALRRRCQRAWADVDVYLRQRHDMIPQLAEVVRGLARQEMRVLQAVLDAQTKALSAASIKERIEAENMISNLLANILPELNKMPELRSSDEFTRLSEAIMEVEEKLAAARRFYNLAVDEYNTALDQFPGMLLRGRAGFRSYRFYSLEAERPVVAERPALNL